MEVAKGVSLEYVGGEVVLKAKIKDLALEAIADVEAKFESGEIDLIKGTDMDKQAALIVIGALKAAL